VAVPPRDAATAAVALLPLLLLLAALLAGGAARALAPPPGAPPARAAGAAAAATGGAPAPARRRAVAFDVCGGRGAQSSVPSSRRGGGGGGGVVVWGAGDAGQEGGNPAAAFRRRCLRLVPPPPPPPPHPGDDGGGDNGGDGGGGDGGGDDGDDAVGALRPRAAPRRQVPLRLHHLPPPLFVQSSKPLRTHLNEVNFSPPGRGGYSIGVTVDPVRISGIRDFGSPGEVAARVVTAELNRDGVFKVTLAKDPAEDPIDGGYDIKYVSAGKRGARRFVTRSYVRDGYLYVLTVQSGEGDYDRARGSEVMECVRNFRPL
jgi:hypothetical protein